MINVLFINHIVNRNLFQKGSPFLEALNYFVDTAFEVGLISDRQGYINIPNSTNCMKWEDVKESHMKADHEVIINLDNTYGIMIMLTSGLGGALIILTLELLIKAKY